MQNRAKLTAALCLGLIGVSLPAAAESSWQSYVAGALTGFESRRWTDTNSDLAATTVRFDRCEDVNTTIEPDTVNIQLQEDVFGPDENKGNRTVYCETSGTVAWGVMAAGDYFWRIDYINDRASGGRVDIPFVKTTF